MLRRLGGMARPGWAGPAGRLLSSWPERARRIQATVGSSSIPAFHDSLARAEQVARALLCRAAAERWNTDWRELQTRSGFVVNGAERIAFGALAQDAARFNLPPEIPALHPSAPRLVGRSMPRLAPQNGRAPVWTPV